MKASDIRELLKLAEKGDVISLAGGLPDPRSFPRNEIAEIARYVVEAYGEKALQYSPTRGVSYFLNAVREFANRHGIEVRSDDGVMATVGSQQGLYLIGRALIDPGDIVVTEEPAYLGAIQAFRVAGAKFLTVPIDSNGLRTDVLEEKLKNLEPGVKERLKIIYTVATCNNPSGTTLPVERRKHLLELAEQYDLVIVEDDPYRFITFAEAEATPIKTLDKNGRVVYMSSFSKILAPGLRLGWLAGPEPIIAKLELVKQSIDLHTPSLTQFIAAEAINRGVVDEHLPRIRSLYREKRDTMLEALSSYMPEGVEWTKPIGGFFVWVWFPEKVNARKLLEKAIMRGVAFVPGDAFYPNGGGENTARLNFSYPSPEEIREGVRRLAEVLKEELANPN
jgi:2-aminoadipate transaminase